MTEEKPQAKAESAVRRRVKDTPVKIAFTVLFVASCFGGIMVTGLIFGWGPIGLWGGLVVGGAFGALLALAYRRLRRTETTPSVLRPGETVCPACGSLQTDIETKPDASDRIKGRWVCFACNHHWKA